MSEKEIDIEKKGEQYQMYLTVTKIFRHVVCVFLCILSLIPFWIMIVNATRASVDIQNKFTLIPSVHLFSNFRKMLFQSGSVSIFTYMLNSLIISVTATVLTVYFSTMTAYGIFVYNFRLNKFAWSFIMAIMMIPMQVTAIGFYKFMYQIGLGNNYIPLIVPAIAAPTTVFFMRQYMQGALPLAIVDAARIDGSGEFYTFNHIVLPILKPAIATQAIFSFVSSWNNLFLPLILLTRQEKYTMPIMVSLLKGDIYKTEYGAIYMGLTLTVLPLFVVYFLLSKYIIAGVALGGVKG